MSASLHLTDPTILVPYLDVDRAIVQKDLSGKDLRGVDFTGRDLSGTRFVGSDLRGAIFFEANLEDAEFLQADLRDAEFTHARGARVGFGAADLRGAKFLDAHFTDASFTDSQMQETDLRGARLEGSRFRGTILQGAEAHSADLSRVDFRGANVAGASFREANFKYAVFTGVVGYLDADWIGVSLQGADFTGAYMVRRHVMDVNYLQEFRSQGLSAEVLYRVWWATSDCGRSLARWTVFTGVVIALFGWGYTLVDIDFGAYKTAISPWYYSVVTFTSLGGGEVLPVSTAAKTLAMAEVVLGYAALGGGLSIFAEKMARRA